MKSTRSETTFSLLSYPSRTLGNRAIRDVMRHGEEGAKAVEQIDFSPAMKQIIKPIERRGQAINIALAGLLIFIIAWGLWATWRDSKLPKINSISIDDVQVIGSTALCPGENLTIIYRLNVQGLGTLMWDDSVMHGKQPVEFSNPKRFYVEGPATLELRDVWQVPTFPDSDSSPMPAWLPGGGYTRYIAVSAPATYTSRFTPPASLKAAFSIRNTCPK
jgi:hypothetical protein